MDQFLNKVFCGDARRLLRALPTASIDACITDAMYGTSKDCRYDWGPDPAKGDPKKHWLYHEPIYRECLRVLKPGGIMAWGQSAKFCEHFPRWFGFHRVWTLTRVRRRGMVPSPHVWVVQTREQQPIDFPAKDSLVLHESLGPLTKKHPCIKPPEEPAFLIESLTSPAQIVLDVFCGLGSTLLAAERLGRSWIGCDLSRQYCRIALMRLKSRR